MTTLLILAIVVLAFLALNWELTRRAKRRALRGSLHSLRTQVDLMLTLRGALRADKVGLVWGRVASPHAFTYRVEGDDRTGRVRVTCQQWDKAGQVTQECSLLLTGSAFLVTDSLKLADQASQFVAQCWVEYTPQPQVNAARKLGSDLLGLVSRWF